MRRLGLTVTLVLVTIRAVTLMIQGAAAQTGPGGTKETGPGGAIRTSNPASTGAITSLPMSNPYCYQADPALNQCKVNVRYWQANDNGAGAILAYVTMSLDGKVRFRSSAFFENFVTYSYDMVPGGLAVACGTPKQAGMGAAYGSAYIVDVRAYDITGNWVLDDQLKVPCPAYAP